MRTPLLVTAALCAFTGIAHAEPGGVSSVSGPSVSEGKLKLEIRTVAWDGGALDDRWQHRAQAGYGFTDFWNAAIILRATQPADENAELTSVAFENKFDLAFTRDWPVHLGVQFEYKIGIDNRDDEIEFKLLAEREIGDLTLRANLIGGRSLADESDWEGAYSARASWRASESFAFGAELFGEPEIDAHYFGLRTDFTFGHTTLSIGYLAGFDEAAADGQLRFTLEYAH